MKLENAFKKLKKHNFTVNQYAPNRYEAKKSGYRYYLRLMFQNDKLDVIDLRISNQEDDPMTDYHAGVYYPNLTQAIKSVERNQ